MSDRHGVTWHSELDSSSIPDEFKQLVRAELIEATDRAIDILVTKHIMVKINDRTRRDKGRRSGRRICKSCRTYYDTPTPGCDTCIARISMRRISLRKRLRAAVLKSLSSQD